MPLTAAQRFLALANGVRTMVAAAIASAGTSTAYQVIAANASGVLDSTFLPPGVGVSTLTFPCTANLTAGMLVNIWSNGGVSSVRPADASTPAQADGFVLSAYSSGATATVYMGAGLITGLSGLTLDARYFLSTVGAVTVTAPTTAAYIVQSVGVAISTTELSFQPSPDPVIVA